MNVNVHLLHPPDAEALAYLQDRLHSDIDLTTGTELPETAVFHILVAGRPTAEQLQASPHLHTLVIPWSGLPDVTYEVLQSFPHLAVHNLHHNAPIVAETVFTLLLAAAKFVIPFDRALRRHDWTPRYQRPSPSVLLRGKTALVLGYGAIGQRVAELCQAFAMEVLATRREVTAVTNDHTAEIHPAHALHTLLPRANALIICLPHTPQTDGLIGQRELALLPSKTVLVNIGRGPIIDEAALYHALRDGTLHAAGLDVWYNYPRDTGVRSHTPPANYPFHELDNVVMSPHRGGHTVETEQLRMAHLADLLNAAARGEPLPNRVDLQAGY